MHSVYNFLRKFHSKDKLGFVQVHPCMSHGKGEDTMLLQPRWEQLEIQASSWCWRVYFSNPLEHWDDYTYWDPFAMIGLLCSGGSQFLQPASMAWSDEFMADLAICPLLDREGFSDLPIPENTKMQEMHLSLSNLLLFIYCIEWKNEYIGWSIISAALLCMSVSAISLEEIRRAGLNWCQTFL